MSNYHFGDPVRLDSSTGSLCGLFEQAADIASDASWRSPLVQEAFNVEHWNHYFEMQMALFKSWTVRLRDLKQKGESTFQREASGSVFIEILTVSTFTRIWHATLLRDSEISDSVQKRLAEVNYIHSRMAQYEQHYLLYLQQRLKPIPERFAFEAMYRFANRWADQVIGVLVKQIPDEIRASSLGQLILASQAEANVSIPVVIPLDVEFLELLERLDLQHQPRITCLSALSRSVSQLAVIHE